MRARRAAPQVGQSGASRHFLREWRMTRETIERASKKYRPKRVALLIVSDAPPAADNRHFYFDQVTSQDLLFQNVIKAVFGETPSREDKPLWLAELKKSGIYFIEASKEPIQGRKDLRPLLPDLIRRCKRLAPTCILLVKATTYDLACAGLLKAGLPVIDAKIPSPAAGQQARFQREFRKALARCARRAAAADGN